MTPTADDVASAIVAASRETGADPIAVARGHGSTDKRDNGGTAPAKPHANPRARTLAVYALRELFPDVTTKSLALMCGASLHQASGFVASVEANRKTVLAPWFNDMALARVIAHVREHSTRSLPVREPAPEPPPPAKRPEPYRPTYRPPADTIKKILEEDAADDRPVFDRGSISVSKARSPPPRAISKQQMQDDLRRAVENTARMRPPREE